MVLLLAVALFYSPWGKQEDSLPVVATSIEGVVATQAMEQETAAAATETATTESAPESEKPGIRRVQYERQGESFNATIYVPPKSEFQRPILLLLDPNGSADGIVGRWKQAAEKNGWFLASSPKIQNGTADEDDIKVLLGLLEYMKSNFNIDSSRVILGGFSGGACGAYAHALGNPQIFRGAVVENGHMGPWRNLRERASGNLRFYLFARSQDFNAEPMRQLHIEMKEKGFGTQFVEIEGAHQPMLPEQAVQALEWFEREL